MSAPPAWDTSSDGAEAHTQPMELATLGEHTTQCSARSGRWVTMRCGAGRLLSFVSTRLVTTGAVLAAGVLVWMLWF